VRTYRGCRTRKGAALTNATQMNDEKRKKKGKGTGSRDDTDNVLANLKGRVKANYGTAGRRKGKGGAAKRYQRTSMSLDKRGEGTTYREA